MNYSLVVMKTAKRRIILNFPPASSVWHLPAGISMLTSVLRNDEHKVVQSYGHIKGLEYVLRQQAQAETDEALRIIRDSNSTILDWYRARMTFERVSGAIKTKDKFRVERNNVVYISQHYNGTIEGLLKAVDERENDMWYEYFTNSELPLVLDVKPHIYGISIADERQLIPGVILASLVKDSSPGTVVVLGGNFWSRVKPAFSHPEFKRLFDFCDAIVYREGFQPTMELAETLQPARASGTVWKSGDSVVINPPAKMAIPFEMLPPPVFDGGVRQWSPDIVPSLYTMSNCPMQCGFCAISSGSDTFLQTPRSMSPARSAEMMIQSGAHRFEISDELFAVNRQLALGEELKKRGYPATWNCYLTMTNDLLDPERCRKLYEAGCRGVQLGLETLSRDTLVREVKSWNHPENYANILKNLSDVGIQNHVFLISGIPGEPLSLNLRWLPFLEEYGDCILTIKQSRYRLTKNSPDEMRDPHDNLITPSPDDKPLHLNRDFHYKDPKCSMKRVDAVRDILEQACRKHWAYAVTSTLPWWANRGRYSVSELREMAKQLPPEPDVDHLGRALTKANTIINEATGQDYSIKTFEELKGLACEL